MSAIGKGDWMECLHDGTYTTFRRGGLYCVSEIYGDRRCTVCWKVHAGLNFTGMPRPHEIGGRRDRANAWPACRFRPIYRPNADLIEQLKQPAPAEPETVSA